MSAYKATKAVRDIASNVTFEAFTTPPNETWYKSTERELHTVCAVHIAGMAVPYAVQAALRRRS